MLLHIIDYMPKKYTEQQLVEFAKKLKAEQDKLEPHLTYDMMCHVLGYKSDYSVTKIVRRLVDAGLAQEVNFGDGKNRYRIL